jgi:hypothetical protein
MKNLHIHAYDDVRDCIRDCMFEHLDKHIRDNYSRELSFGQFYIYQSITNSCLSSVINFTKNYNYEN